MILPGFGPRPCSYEVMAAAGCPRRRPTGHSQVNPGLEDGWCMGQAAAASNIASKRALLEHSLRNSRALLRDFIISVGVSRFRDALPKAARANGESGRRGGTGPLPNPESKRPCYAASTFSASSRLARIIFLAASTSSAAGLPGASSFSYILSAASRAAAALFSRKREYGIKGVHGAEGACRLFLESGSWRKAGASGPQVDAN